MAAEAGLEAVSMRMPPTLAGPLAGEHEVVGPADVDLVADAESR